MESLRPEGWFFAVVFCLCVGSCTDDMNGSEDNFKELVLLFPHLDSWDQTQVIKLGITSTFTILPAQLDLGALTPNPCLSSEPTAWVLSLSVSSQPFSLCFVSHLSGQSEGLCLSLVPFSDLTSLAGSVLRLSDNDLLCSMMETQWVKDKTRTLTKLLLPAA